MIFMCRVLFLSRFYLCTWKTNTCSLRTWHEVSGSSLPTVTQCSISYGNRTAQCKIIHIHVSEAHLVHHILESSRCTAVCNHRWGKLYPEVKDWSLSLQKVHNVVDRDICLLSSLHVFDNDAAARPFIGCYHDRVRRTPPACKLERPFGATCI